MVEPICSSQNLSKSINHFSHSTCIGARKQIIPVLYQHRKIKEYDNGLFCYVICILNMCNFNPSMPLKSTLWCSHFIISSYVLNFSIKQGELCQQFPFTNSHCFFTHFTHPNSFPIPLQHI